MVDGLLKSVFEILHLEYALSSLLITYMLIEHVDKLKTATPKRKSLVSFIVSLALGVLFWLIDPKIYTVPELIFSATAAVTLYEWFVKHVLSTFGIGATKKEEEQSKNKKEESQKLDRT